MTTDNKPFIVEIEEAEKETVEMVNEIMGKHHLSCYIYERIFDKVHGQLKDAGRNELAIATAQYEAQKKEESAEKEGEAK